MFDKPTFADSRFLKDSDKNFLLQSNLLQKSPKSFGKIESTVVYIVRGKVQQKPFAKRDIE